MKAVTSAPTPHDHQLISHFPPKSHDSYRQLPRWPYAWRSCHETGFIHLPKRFMTKFVKFLGHHMVEELLSASVYTKLMVLEAAGGSTCNNTQNHNICNKEVNISDTKINCIFFYFIRVGHSKNKKFKNMFCDINVLMLCATGRSACRSYSIPSDSEGGGHWAWSSWT